MSLRDILDAEHSTKQPCAHNPHNPNNKKKTTEVDNCADCADCAEGDSKLLETLASATRGLSITPAEVRDALAPEDILDWNNGDFNPETLRTFAKALEQQNIMERGEVPTHYTYRATCTSCGPVWLWFAGKVDGCPWCWNKAANKPIPRPVSVRCGDCQHFERTDRPHLGQCRKGEPAALAGLWDSDQRDCSLFIPMKAET